MKRKRKDRERQGEEKAETEKKEKRECRKKYQPGPDPLWGYCRDILLRIILGIFEGLKWKNWLIRAQNQFHVT